MLEDTNDEADADAARNQFPKISLGVESYQDSSKCRKRSSAIWLSRTSRIPPSVHCIETARSINLHEELVTLI
jgi:hypothetical protein